MPTHHKRHGPARTANEPNTNAPAETATATESQPAETPKPQQGGRPPGLNITDLKDMSIQKLTQVAKDMAVAGATGCASRS